MRILVIEDDKALAETIQDKLSQFYSVDVAHTGSQGMQRTRSQKNDVIILDLMLPDRDGVSVCKEIRSEQIKTPLLILTAKDSVDQKVTALDAGADDYLTKPFHFEELLARIRALLRRHTNMYMQNQIRIGNLSIDIMQHRVVRNSKDIVLRRKEFCLLEYLARHQGQVVTRQMILDHVWSREIDPMSNTVDVHINYLRNKIDRPFHRKLIKTVPGIGYKLDV